MNCAACKIPTIVLELEGVEIDYCTRCKGVWLDTGELELLLSEAENVQEILDSVTIVKTKEKALSCPICHKHLDKVEYGADDKVLLDKCPNNDGIFFDKGELSDVISLGRSEEGRVVKLLKEIFGEVKTQ